MDHIVSYTYHTIENGGKTLKIQMIKQNQRKHEIKGVLSLVESVVWWDLSWQKVRACRPQISHTHTSATWANFWITSTAIH